MRRTIVQPESVDELQPCLVAQSGMNAGTVGQLHYLK
jgi:hypothetical protein